MSGNLFKNITRYMASCLLALPLLALSSCGAEENITSVVNVLITDAPIDAQNVKSVTIVISDVAWKRGGKWETLAYLERPLSVDLLSLPEGQGFLLANKDVEPGIYSALRITLKLANQGDPLIISPRSNIEFLDGTISNLYWFDEQQPTEVVIETEIDIPTRQFTQLIVDLDLRKSIRLTSAGDYILEPIVRLINTKQMGSIEALVVNTPANHRILVYAYEQGTFSDSEMMSSDETVAFKNSITSAVLKANSKLLLPFLELGKYELIFVEYSETGSAVKVLKQEPDIEVTTGKPTTLRIDLG